MSFDLNSLSGLSEAQEKGIDVSITHPKTGEPLGIVINGGGPDSKKQKAGRAAVIDDRVDTRVSKITAQRLDDEANLTAAHSINWWKGVIIDGKTIELSVESAIMVFEKWPFIREQYQARVDNRASFIKT